MSNLTQLIAQARSGLSIQQRISTEQWRAIATHCGGAEIEEIEQRIAALHAELPTIEDWDGDTQDEIHLAIQRFNELLALARANQPTIAKPSTAG